MPVSSRSRTCSVHSGGIRSGEDAYAIDHDGNGNLLYSSSTTGEVGVMDTAGMQIGVLFTASQSL